MANPYSDKEFRGVYRAVVQDNNDPKKLGRLKLYVPELFGTALTTDWANPMVGTLSATRLPDAPRGSWDMGTFWIPDIDMGVWCQFEAGDISRPVWSGVWWAEPDGVSEAPKLAKGEEDETVQSLTYPLVTGTTVFDEVSQDPFDAVYPFNRVIKTKAGHVIEVDDTENAERVKVTHKSGTFIEISPDGGIRMKVEGDIKQEVMGNLYQKVHGDWGIEVSGDIVRESGSHIQDTAPRIDHN